MDTLYVLVPEDKCAKNVGLQCGYPKARHPMDVSGNYHKFKPGRMTYVKATQEQIDAASTAKIMAPMDGDF